MPWRRRFRPFVQPFYRAYWRVSRGMTLGVRAVVVNAEGEVLLVEHTYSHGWHLPGGGVERGETVEAALARELVEEAGVVMNGPPTLVGVRDNYAAFHGDHVVCFRIDRWTRGEATSRGEILHTCWAAPDALPPGVSRLTRVFILQAAGSLSPGARIGEPPPLRRGGDH
ncbi:MAG: NUDIX domain-containing protein [Caulobacteraceae bacterium]|nr:NUDIX domain-containing protein [Caulobacteraceae bacterium]